MKPGSGMRSVLEWNATVCDARGYPLLFIANFCEIGLSRR